MDSVRSGRDNGARRTASSFPENTIENDNWDAVLMTLDYIPDLCNPSAGGVTGLRKPNRKRWTDLRLRWVPPFRSGDTDVMEPATGSEGAHSPCAKHVEDFGRAKDQRHPAKYWEEELE